MSDTMYREYRCETCGRSFVVKNIELGGRITCSSCGCSGNGFKKCRSQLSDDCRNWTDEGLTHDTSQMWEGGVLIDYPKPVCSPCLKVLQRGVAP